MSHIALLYWILNTLLDTAGHLILKSVATPAHETEFERWKAMLLSPRLWLGIACFCCEFIAWFGLISVVPLSVAVLIGSANIVVVMLAGAILFHEKLDLMRIVGVSFISIGVALASGFA